MEYPGSKTDWNVFPLPEFNHAEVRDPGNIGVELMVQARNNGRLVDHFRVAVGGREMLTVETNLSRVFRHNNLNNYRLRFQYWPRDISIRRNATTSAWKGVYEMLAERNAVVLREDGTTVPRDDILDAIRAIENPEEKAAAIRWAVTVDDNRTMKLDLVTLPASEDAINSKPLLKR